MVFYRKYRPQTIEELDSQDVVKTLSSVLTHETIPHAFLFTGPKGLGKTSTARIVAKYVNCEKVTKVPKVSKGETKKAFGTSDTSGTFAASSVIPCNECISCTSITEGTNLDVLEIDGASNRGIDEMRDLREKIRLLPVSAHKKVYIIDEVHMLTTEAFNALLKTLEEPPPHAMFILCTTESHKVPPTILSRCFHIAFKKAGIEDLVHSFERIIAAEKIDIDKEALVKIASFSDGSFRDGAKILEEIVIAANGKKITVDMLGSFYHTQNIDSDIVELLQSLQANDKKKSLVLVQRLVTQGTDMKYFLEQVLLYLHKILLVHVGISDEKIEVVLEENMLKRMISVLGVAHGEIKSAVLPQLPLELAIVEWEGQEKLRMTNDELRKSPPVIASEARQSPSPLDNKPAPSSVSPDDKTFLHQILDSIKGDHHMLAGVLRGCKVRLEGNTVIIEALSSFHKQRLEDQKALEVLEKVCEDITGKSVKISVVLK